MKTVLCITIPVKVSASKIPFHVEEHVIVRICEIGDLRYVIKLHQTKFLNKGLSDTSSMGTCIVKKHYNAVTEHSTPFVLNCSV